MSALVIHDKNQPKIELHSGGILARLSGKIVSCGVLLVFASGCASLILSSLCGIFLKFL